MTESQNEEVLLATENVAKQERLARLVEAVGMAWITPEEAGLEATEGQEQEGASHQANAMEKATAWSLAYGGMAIASDGGLVVPGLGAGWDSVRTRRFSAADDLGRGRELLSLMAHLEGNERRAYWVEALALAHGGMVLQTLVAQSGEGAITLDVREDLIKDGFWVGAVWFFPQVGKRYAELTPAELQRVGDHWWSLEGLLRKSLGRAQ